MSEIATHILWHIIGKLNLRQKCRLVKSDKLYNFDSLSFQTGLRYTLVTCNIYLSDPAV